MRREIRRPRLPLMTLPDRRASRRVKTKTARDVLFREAPANAQDFQFDSATADVFDDMLERSVPFYDEVQSMLVELARSFAQDGSRVYDLGCSTGTTMSRLAQSLAGRPVRIIGVDSSVSMIEKAREKLRRAGVWRRCSLLEAHLDKSCPVRDASVVIMNLTLQFIRPLHRGRMISAIHRGLRKGGCLILCEKIMAQQSPLGRLFVDLYHNYKERQGYSKLEIARKREALENVLIPYRFDENVELLRRRGFSIVEEFFRWYNFCGIIAVKT